MTMLEGNTATIIAEREIRDLLDSAGPAELRVLLTDILQGSAWFDREPMGRA